MGRGEAYVTVETLDRRLAGWLDEVRQTTRRRPGFELQPSTCALLVIDMQRHFACRDGRAFLPATTAIIPRVWALLALWRARGAPVAFLRHGHRGPDALGIMGRFYSDWLRTGEADAEIIKELRPEPEELIISKRTYDSFYETELEPMLRARGVGQVLVTGVLTHLCCEATARSAFVRGFEVYLAADGTASSSEALHLGSLRAAADGFGIVMSSREVLRQCANWS